MNIKLWFNWKVVVCTIFPFVIPILMDNIGDYMEGWVKIIVYAIFVIADVIGICYFNKNGDTGVTLGTCHFCHLFEIFPASAVTMEFLKGLSPRPRCHKI